MSLTDIASGGARQSIQGTAELSYRSSDSGAPFVVILIDVAHSGASVVWACRASPDCALGIIRGLFGLVF